MASVNDLTMCQTSDDEIAGDLWDAASELDCPEHSDVRRCVELTASALSLGQIKLFLEYCELAREQIEKKETRAALRGH